MTDKHLDKKMSATAYEIAYLRTIGRNHEETKKLPRDDMLRGYLDGCNKRTHWGDLDKVKIVMFARTELEKIA